MIEARIVEAEDSFSRSLGVKLGFNDRSRMGTTYVPDPANAGKFIQVPTRTDSGVMFGGNTDSLQSLSGQNSATGIGQVPTVANTMINFPAAASAAGTDPAAFAMTLFNAGLTRFINLELTALETDGKGKMISIREWSQVIMSKPSLSKGLRFLIKSRPVQVQPAPRFARPI